ncbi:protein DA1 [Physcomitrium patens]|uniref:LIM zinc-binding domain-containing protein n=1 Tax=Physcomitrium patens TaxID=3218 RepID=A0A2K1L3V0_PHYPA|nr:protein DA1-like [Physcomitrium patens]XP_024368281.1 protein DA1-like [Physcomitrium patens]PNR60693.1 hypothetical protein PHYPA_003486 [Physcomitrium patens]|eukprot:XP_024368280.1 protein DA1-like [Physcomitrella patens]
MGWLDSIFGSGSGSGSSDHRRYSENEYYEYSRHSSGPSHSGGGFSSDSWRGPNIFEDPYANVYSSYGRSNPYDNERSSQGYGSSSLDCGHYSHDSGRSYQDYRNPYGYMGPGYGYGFDYGASSEPSYLARRSTEEDRQSTKQVASDDDESRAETEDEFDNEAGDLARDLGTLSIHHHQYPPPQRTSVIAPYNHNYMPAPRSAPQSTCAGCKQSLSHGRFLTCLHQNWHPSCFCCRSCGKAIVDREFSVQEDAPYHRECYKKSFHPKCEICYNFIPPNSKGLIEYRSHPFWDQKYCPSHEWDGRRRCCSCDRIEKIDQQYTPLGDGRKLCEDCMESNVMDTRGCQPLYREILKFYKGLGMPIEQEIPMLLVKRAALNHAREAEKDEHIHAPETRGLCLSEEQTITTVFVSDRGEYGDYAHPEMQTRKLTRHCEVTAILVLFGLPRLLTGSILAHELMHAWIRLDGRFPNLDNDIEEGICQVIAHIWLKEELEKLKRSVSRETKRLGEFFLHQIETDSSPIYGDGFRAAYTAYKNYGLAKTLNHLRNTGRILQ